MKRIIKITDSEYVWHIPLEAIADNRAKYYAERDSDTTYQAEFDYVMSDDYEGIDWYCNNMDFEDVADKAVLVFTPEPLTAPGLESEVELDTVP